jgi:hypothetical protein
MITTSVPHRPLAAIGIRPRQGSAILAYSARSDARMLVRQGATTIGCSISGSSGRGLFCAPCRRSASPASRSTGIASAAAFPAADGPRQFSAEAPPPPADSDAAASELAPPKTGFRRGFWTFIDVFAILGSVGGAVAALLGIGTTAYVLALPMCLPVVSLIAALNREGLIAEVRSATAWAHAPGVGAARSTS